jgi:hypothetical protein
LFLQFRCFFIYTLCLIKELQLLCARYFLQHK